MAYKSSKAVSHALGDEIELTETCKEYRGVCEQGEYSVYEPRCRSDSVGEVEHPNEDYKRYGTQDAITVTSAKQEGKSEKWCAGE